MTPNILTAQDSLNVGSFTVIPVLYESNGTSALVLNDLHLSDANGDTYIWNETDNIKIPSATVTKQVKVKLQVTYTKSTQGTEDVSKASLNAMWKAAIAAHGFHLETKDGTDYTSEVDPTDGNDPKSIKDAATTAGHANQYGLKFGADSNTALANETRAFGSSVAYAYSAIDDWGGDSDLVGTIATSYTFYMGVWGIDNFEQKAADQYILSVAAVLTDTNHPVGTVAI